MRFFNYVLSFFLFRYIDIDKIHAWFWKISGNDYNKFKSFLRISSIVSMILYFLTAFSGLFLLSNVKLSFENFLKIFVALYIAIGVLMLNRKGFYKSYYLILFNFDRLKNCNDSNKIRRIVSDLAYEFDKFNKRRSKLISIYSVYINNFVASINMAESLTFIKDFFDKSSEIVKEKNWTRLLGEMIALDSHINNQEEYKNMQNYMEGISDIKKGDNLFSYLNKIDDYLDKKRRLNKVLSGIDLFFRKGGEHLTVIISIIVLILLFFFPGKFSTFIQIFT